MSRNGYNLALTTAVKSLVRLAHPQTPVPTSPWASKKVSQSSSDGYKTYTVTQQDNKILYDYAVDYYKHTTGLQRQAEKDWFEKYFVFRNWYLPEFYANTMTPWFLPGGPLPKGFFDYCKSFWQNLLPTDYRVLNSDEIKCPKQDASTGLTFTSEGWIYASNSGNYWPEIQEGADILAHVLTPTDILYSTSIPSYRLESGPQSPRVVNITSKHLYVLQRRFIAMLQDEFVNKDSYIGKASNCFSAAFTDKKLFIGTHGDDWIAKYKNKWYNGDWSTWDILVTGQQVQVSLEALFTVLDPYLDDHLRNLFRALQGLAVRRSVLWPWARGKTGLFMAPSIRPIEGHVDSGSGWFVMLNNCLNSSGLKLLFERFRKQKFNWIKFRNYASAMFGWNLKVGSEMSSPSGFIACRTLFNEELGWQPEPLILSLVRNAARPNYDPNSAPYNARIAHATRLRSLNSVLRFTQTEIADSFTSAIDESCKLNGFDDPWGSEWTERDLAGLMAGLIGEQDTYGMDAFLNS